MRLFQFYSIIALILLSFSCSKKGDGDKICGTSYGETPIERRPSYLDPQWGPGGNFIAFNHLPVNGLITNTCGMPYFANKYDSAGLYLIKKEGTGFTRVTDKPLQLPKWSPDGNWLAYLYMGDIMLIPFDGTRFDTAAKVKVTTNHQNQSLAWSPDSDSLYFLNTATISATSSGKLFRIGIDGKGLTEIGEGSISFSVTDDRIYFSHAQNIFSTKKDGSDRQQVTSGNEYKRFPLVRNNVLYYQTGSLISQSLPTGVAPTQLAEGIYTFDVSSTGEIVYSNWLPNTDQANAQNGTLWIMNADGSNKKQLTRNNL